MVITTMLATVTTPTRLGLKVETGMVLSEGSNDDVHGLDTEMKASGLYCTLLVFLYSFVLEIENKENKVIYYLFSYCETSICSTYVVFVQSFRPLRE